MKPWVKYTIIRVGLFVVLFAITYPLFLASGIMTLQISGIAAAVISAVASLCISYLAFAGIRNEMALEVAERRERPPVNPDEAAEDELTDDGTTADEAATDLEGDRPGQSQAE